MSNYKFVLTFALYLTIVGITNGQEIKEFQNCLGKNIGNEDVRLLINKFNVTDTTEIPTGFFYNARKQGISFKCNKQKILTHVFLYKEGIDGFNQYQRAFPFGLSFDLSRTQAEAILGKPIRTGGGTYSNIYAIYNGGISLTFSTMNTNDYSAKIEVINIIEE